MSATAINIDRAAAIDGYMTRDELRWLARRAQDCQGIVEVGCFRGRSTRALADHCPGTVIAVDPWDGGYLNDDGSPARWLDTRKARADFEANLADHISCGRVVQIVKPFRTAQQLAGISADMVFLDGDHRYSEVLADIEQARRLLKPGGLLCGHDYGHVRWPGVKRAVDEFFGAAIQLRGSIWWVVP